MLGSIMNFKKSATQRPQNTVEPNRLQKVLSEAKTIDQARIVSEVMREMEVTATRSVLEARLDRYKW